jgi:hypothetical protein
MMSHCTFQSREAHAAASGLRRGGGDVGQHPVVKQLSGSPAVRSGPIRFVLGVQ